MLTKGKDIEHYSTRQKMLLDIDTVLVDGLRLLNPSAQFGVCLRVCEVSEWVGQVDLALVQTLQREGAIYNTRTKRG